MISELRVGPAQAQDGAINMQRAGKTGETMVSDTHGRFYEPNVRGTVFSNGMTLTSIAAATFTTATLGATCTPILGVWNPLGSGKNLVILQAKLQLIITNLTMTGGGAYMWAVSTNNGAISTGSAPLNRSTLSASGSVAKGMAGVALTGLTNNLVVQEASALMGASAFNISEVQTAAGFLPPPVAALDNIDGSIIVPPGGVLALLCTTTPVALSAASSLMWEEVAI